MQKVRKAPSAAERMFHVKHPEGIRSFRII